MQRLTLIAALLTLMTPQMLYGQQQSPSLSVLSTQVEVVSDYAADTRSTNSATRATAVPNDHSEAAGAFDRLDGLADRNLGKKYRVSIIVSNVGTRAIRAVTLEYTPGYSHGHKPPALLRFKVRREIKPGETQTLSHTFVMARHVVLRSVEQATVKSIEYKDGSVWRR